MEIMRLMVTGSVGAGGEWEKGRGGDRETIIQDLRKIYFK